MTPESEPGPEPHDEPRRYPSTIGGGFYLLILALTTAGIVVATVGPWRSGVRIVAGALLGAAVVRLALRDADAGMLAVRHRAVDCAVLTVLGSALIFLTYSIPDQPV